MTTDFLLKVGGALGGASISASFLPSIVSIDFVALATAIAAVVASVTGLVRAVKAERKTDEEKIDKEK